MRQAPRPPHRSPIVSVRLALLLATACGLLLAGPAVAHHDEPTPVAKVPAATPPVAIPVAAPAAATTAPARTSGQGKWVFTLNRELSALPEKAKPFLRGAHGGFAVDAKHGGTVYFALKGCGIIRMSRDLQTKTIIEVDPYVRQGNFHNTTMVYDAKGTAFLALPDNERQRVYITTTEGALVQVLSHPRGNAYYDKGGAFVPTDVEQISTTSVFVVTGYSPGDFVVTADPLRGTWQPLIFGGKGREHGKFGTGHGITWNARKKTIDIADRPHSRIESFDTKGNYQTTVTLPAGSLPCDIDFLGDVALVGCLKGPGGKTPAPVYVLDRDGKVISTVEPGAELGLGEFTHVHNATWHTAGEGENAKTYILCQAWNPGGFAVLERK